VAVLAARRIILSTSAEIRWTEDGVVRTARWHSDRGAAPPQRVQVVDDTVTADAAYGLAAQGVALLWRSDFQNARQMLVALGKRADRRKKSPARPAAEMPLASAAMTAAFHAERQTRAQRSRTLSTLLIELDGDFRCALRRAPDVQAACREALATGDGPVVLSLRELLGIIGAHEWRLNGVVIPAAGFRIHPHYGVFAPIRQEYVGLVAEAPLPAALQADPVAFDIGTGTGVLAAVLARRSIANVIATDLEPRALACATENIDRLGLAEQVAVQEADLYPQGKAALVVCNPPWLPGRAASSLERAVYDPDSGMLRGFLSGLAGHLVPGGEGWLIVSDLAEHLGLRTREQLLGWINDAGLQVLGRIDSRPTHPRVADTTDPLHAARSAEVTSLWRLGGANR
jgi:methylase of polypeptide subunit release factors